MFGISAFAQAPFSSLVGQNKNVILTGVSAAGAVGTVVRSASVALTGVQALGVADIFIVPLLSNQAEGAVGSVGYELVIELTGNASSAAVESVGVGARTFGLTGNQAQGYVGTLIAVYWKIIDDSQTPNWQNISNPQTPGWGVVNDSQNADWELIETV